MKTADIAQVLEKLLRKKLTKEQGKILKEKFPKNSVVDVDSVIDLLYVLAEIIEIDGEKLIEYNNWDIILTLYLYFVAPQDTIFMLIFSKDNLAKTLQILEDELQVLKTISESEEIKKMLEERQKEIEKEEEEKKAQSSP